MEYKTVLYKKQDGIIVISLNRPEKLNAIDGQLSRDFLAALMEAEADTEAKVVIIRGEGRAFCAGFDLSQSGSPERQVPLEYQRDTGQNITRAMMRMPKIVIAAVHGYAIGAGLEWTMGADLRVVAEGTQFGATETNVGQTVTNAGTKLLTHHIGLSKAKELYFTNEFMDAEEAHRLGYVNKLVPPDKLESASMEMAKRIDQNSGLSLMLTKQAVNRALSMSIEETLQMETRDSQLNALSPSQQEYGRAAMQRLQDKKR
ncbi:MAG TPA: enoyl-CoA hydratase/isomerase family protein [Dehalococcoidia bacterium]|nr:enoyl-CoA hydratase/isomerase family protein [Dehalococcoidia bacterium]